MDLTAIDEKIYLTISETGHFLNTSRRSLYRMFDPGQLIPGKAGRRTLIKRSDIDTLFYKPPAEPPKAKKYGIPDCYTITQVQDKYKVSAKALNGIIKRNAIPRITKGWFVYIPKEIINSLFSINQTAQWLAQPK